MGRVVEYIADDEIVEQYTRQLLDALRPHVLYTDSGHVTVTSAGFDLLPEYSTSLPTGVADGKVWKAKTRKSGWVIREYVDEGDPEAVKVYGRTLGVV